MSSDRKTDLGKSSAKAKRATLLRSDEGTASGRPTTELEQEIGKETLDKLPREQLTPAGAAGRALKEGGDADRDK